MQPQDCREELANSETTKAALVIAYLTYAVDDVRALSERSTSLLQSAIAVLKEETADEEVSAAGVH
jgi:RNA polymerase-interacting CarD/CdnL/TRCF family regulator